MVIQLFLWENKATAWKIKNPSSKHFYYFFNLQMNKVWLYINMKLFVIMKSLTKTNARNKSCCGQTDFWRGTQSDELESEVYFQTNQDLFHFLLLFGFPLVLEYFASRSDRKLLKFFSLDFCLCYKMRQTQLNRIKSDQTNPNFIHVRVHWVPEASSQGCCPDRWDPFPSAVPLLLVALCQPGMSHSITMLRLDNQLDNNWKHPFPFLTLFLRAFFFFSLSRANAGNALTSPLSTAAWMMLQILGSSSWVQHRAEAVMASMSPWCCTYSWSTSFLSSSEPLYFFSNSRMSCTVIYGMGGKIRGCKDNENTTGYKIMLCNLFMMLHPVKQDMCVSIHKYVSIYTRCCKLWCIRQVHWHSSLYVNILFIVWNKNSWNTSDSMHHIIAWVTKKRLWVIEPEDACHVLVP